MDASARCYAGGAAAARQALPSEIISEIQSMTARTLKRPEGRPPEAGSRGDPGASALSANNPVNRLAWVEHERKLCGFEPMDAGETEPMQKKPHAKAAKAAK